MDQLFQNGWVLGVRSDLVYSGVTHFRSSVGSGFIRTELLTFSLFDNLGGEYIKASAGYYDITWNIIAGDIMAWRTMAYSNTIPP